MAPIGKLYAGSNNGPRTWRTFAAAKYAGVELEYVQKTAAEIKEGELAAKFPYGKIPAFESADGLLLTESRAVARYVASFAKNANLLGTDEKTAALVDQWSEWADDELLNPVIRVRLPVWVGTPYFKPAEQAGLDAISRALNYLESYLKKNTFLVGHRITLADLTAANVLHVVFSQVLGEASRAKFPNSVRYYTTVVNQPAIADFKPNNELAKEDHKYVAPKKEEKPKAAPAAAAAAAAAAAGGAAAASSKKKSKKDDDDDDDEPLVPAEPKVKNPLDDLPKSSFNLEEWKRVYSNQDTRKEALPWFHQNFDKDGFSVWRFDFKYNEELTQVFMSNNQIGGFFNRLEASRKYVMGTAGVFGKANDSVIAGVVITRGKDYKPVLEVAPDLESYAVTPLDITTEEGKKFFDDMMAWEAVIGGKEWADGKVLK